MKQLFLLFSLLFLTSCNNPLDNTYSSETFELDLKEIKDKGKVTNDELRIIAVAVIRNTMLNVDMNKMTYREILNDANSFLSEQEELAKKAKEELELKNKLLSNAVKVAVYNKGFEEFKYDSALTFNYIIENKSDKSISAMMFTFTIIDELGDELERYRVKITDKNIEPNTQFKEVAYFDYNQFISNHNRIKNANFDKLKIVAEVVKIVYSDGTILE